MTTHHSRSDRQDSTVAGPFWKRALGLFALGLLGVAGLAATVYLQVGGGGGTLDLPPATYAAVSAIQPAVLLAVAVLVGTWAAPRVGLVSRVHDRLAGTPTPGSLRAEARIAIPLGLGVGLTILLADLALAPLVARDVSTVASAPGNWNTVDVLVTAPVRFLYGGITEELLVRWGLLSPLAWVGWRLTGRPDRPGRGVFWAAVVASALAFGLGHLPALATAVEPTPLLVVRTVALNAAGGVVFGWLFWRYSLEAAMVSHASAHVVFLGAQLATVL